MKLYKYRNEFSSLSFLRTKVISASADVNDSHNRATFTHSRPSLSQRLYQQVQAFLILVYYLVIKKKNVKIVLYSRPTVLEEI